MKSDQDYFSVQHMSFLSSSNLSVKAVVELMQSSSEVESVSWKQG